MYYLVYLPNLSIYVFYIAKYLINYLLTFSTLTPSPLSIMPINLLRFALIHGWWT
jgi:hypothetical protein